MVFRSADGPVCCPTTCLGSRQHRPRCHWWSTMKRKGKIDQRTWWSNRAICTATAWGLPNRQPPTTSAEPTYRPELLLPRMVDNCLLGRFVNAIYQMYGDNPAKILLSGWTQFKHNNLQRTKVFVSHLRDILGPLLGQRVNLQWMKDPFTLKSNDHMPHADCTAIDW
jgi:hypothetical protein